MLGYLILVVTSVLVGLAAVFLVRRNGKLDPKAFLVGVLVNAVALGSILLSRRRRQR